MNSWLTPTSPLSSERGFGLLLARCASEADVCTAQAFDRLPDTLTLWIRPPSLARRANKNSAQSIRNIGQEILVLLPCNELLGHHFLLFLGQAVDLLLLVREFLQISGIDLGFLGCFPEVLANAFLIDLQSLQVAHQLRQLALNPIPQSLECYGLRQLLLQGGSDLFKTEQIMHLSFRAVAQADAGGDIELFLNGERFRLACLDACLKAIEIGCILDWLFRFDQLELLVGAVGMFDEQRPIGLASINDFVGFLLNRLDDCRDDPFHGFHAGDLL